MIQILNALMNILPGKNSSILVGLILAIAGRIFPEASIPTVDVAVSALQHIGEALALLGISLKVEGAAERQNRR
jgi:hypothetical protein